MMNEAPKKQENYVEKPHILVVDDDSRIRDLVVRYLNEHDFVAFSAEDAQEARDALQHFESDALVVDVMMPGETGLEFMQSLRDEGNDVPAIMLTALGEVDDRIHGLESGADDYLTKPFEPRELVLRLRSLLKRRQGARQAGGIGSLRIGPWVFDEERGVLIANDATDGQVDKVVKLTAMDINLLNALAEDAGNPVSREVLAQKCGMDAGERTIDVQVTRLRRKIEEDTKLPRYLQTVRGQGYLLRVDPL